MCFDVVFLEADKLAEFTLYFADVDFVIHLNWSLYNIMQPSHISIPALTQVIVKQITNLAHWNDLKEALNGVITPS